MMHTKLTQTEKAAWVAALRSGTYTQGRTELRQRTTTGFKHCCLGVLCEVKPGLNVQMTNYQPLHDVLGTGLVDDLWRMNDRYPGGTSFADIATFIEREVGTVDGN